MSGVVDIKLGAVKMSDVKNKPNPQAKALLASLENTAVVQLRLDAVMDDGAVLPQTLTCYAP